MSGYVDIGNGIAARTDDALGYVVVITGPEWERIQRERRDGPLFVEAMHRGRDLTQMAFHGWRGGPHSWHRDPNWAGRDSEGPITPEERDRGIPAWPR